MGTGGGCSVPNNLEGSDTRVHLGINSTVCPTFLTISGRGKGAFQSAKEDRLCTEAIAMALHLLCLVLITSVILQTVTSSTFKS